MDSDTKSGLCSSMLQPAKWHSTWTFLCLLAFYFLCCYVSNYIQHKCYQYSKHKVMHLFFSDKSIDLFELFDPWWKREASKSRDYQGQEVLHTTAQEKNLYHISLPNNPRPWDFCCPASNIPPTGPTHDPKLITPPLRKSFDRQLNWLTCLPVIVIGIRRAPAQSIAQLCQLCSH